MDLNIERRLLVRRLVLSAAVVGASAAYVWSQPGRLPLATAIAAAIATPSEVRLGSSQTVKVKDGEYRGTRNNARFGFVRAIVTVAGGRIVSVRSEEYPDHSPTSVRINLDALPKLEQEVITAQSVVVDVITGATLTSKAWERSVRSAVRSAARS